MAYPFDPPINKELIPTYHGESWGNYISKYRMTLFSTTNVCKELYACTLNLAHSSVSRGHFSIDITMRKSLLVGIWWPTLIKETKTVIKRCDRLIITHHIDQMPMLLVKP